MCFKLYIKIFSETEGTASSQSIKYTSIFHKNYLHNILFCVLTPHIGSKSSLLLNLKMTVEAFILLIFP